MGGNLIDSSDSNKSRISLDNLNISGEEKKEIYHLTLRYSLDPWETRYCLENGEGLKYIRFFNPRMNLDVCIKRYGT